MPNLTPEAWAQIRADYEHTERPIEDICAAHGISSGTLRDRVRRWKWTRRRPPISREGPPPLPVPPRAAALAVPALAATKLASGDTIDDAYPPAADAPHAAPPEAAPVDVSPALVAQRLQGAVARVLPAIEATLCRIAGGSSHPRELENAARALGALMRTLRELNALLAQNAVQQAEYDNLDEFRAALIRKMDAIIAERPEDETTGDSIETVAPEDP